MSKLNIPVNPTEPTPLYTKSGELIASTYNRVVIGERGPYVEFLSDYQLMGAFIYMPEDQKWRDTDHWKNKVYYLEYRTLNDNVMVYFQLKTVKYADYKIKHWYISPYDLYTKDGKPAAEGQPPKWKLE